MNSNIRTDLAVESEALRREMSPGAIPGVRETQQSVRGFGVTVLEVLDEAGERALGKPRGRYITVALDALLRREENAFVDACAVLSERLRTLLPPGGACLVVGLGNRDITPDAIGPAALDSVMVTRHLKHELPGEFPGLRPVSAVCTGVLGTTGIESGELVRAVVEQLHPDVVIAVDALASRAPERLCCTVQIADTGIVPGSGVGNARKALNAETLGVPVIAIGVPTVVDAATLALDLAAKSGVQLNPETFGAVGGMIVTPREIDRNVQDAAKLIGYAINLALHEGIGIADIDMFLS